MKRLNSRFKPFSWNKPHFHYILVKFMFWMQDQRLEDPTTNDTEKVYVCVRNGQQKGYVFIYLSITVSISFQILLKKIFISPLLRSNVRGDIIVWSCGHYYENFKNIFYTCSLLTVNIKIIRWHKSNVDLKFSLVPKSHKPSCNVSMQQVKPSLI